ncbi:uncharacterized protein LOC132731888 [Ruditapes philippinarum]|uniref:uncharacterized protein LOC132731888 n=1 Tax=Ruditapes philippinarum TaxID=129788 RepID=UPI00295B4A49|nr:uncharacterized protein LOC132731888 [Ruditapes philippinarum]
MNSDHTTHIMPVKVIVVLYIMLGCASSFLLVNSSANIGVNEYRDLISLLVDEKNARHMLENRLDKLEQFNLAVTKELQKDKNNRQQLIDENTKIIKDLENASKHLTILQQENDLLKEKYVNQSYVVDELLEQSKMNENLTDQFQSLSNSQEHLLKNYHVLLDQYLAFTSQDKANFVEKHDFNQAISRVNNSLLYANESIHNITLQTSLNREKILKTDIQLGFSLKVVDKAASSTNRLKFKTSLFNTDHVFNLSTGEFICTRAGVYFFTTTIVREPGIKEAFCEIRITRRNSNNIIATQITVGQASSTSGYASGTNSLVYHLNVGDKASLSYCHGIDHMHLSSSFSGFLIVSD